MATLRRRAVEERQFGFITTTVTVDDWVQPKYLQQALKELHLEGFWPERDAAGKAKA